MIQYIYGKNTVLERLTQKKEVVKLYLQRGSKLDNFQQIAQKNRIEVIFLENKEMTTMAEGGNHQGVIAELFAYAFVPLETMLAAPLKNKYPLYVMLDGLEDPHNLGAILRTCDAIGVDGVIIGKHRSVGLTATVAKVSTGAIEHVSVAQVTNLRQTIDYMKERGIWVVGSDCHKASDYRTLPGDMPLLLIVGSEGKGISKLVLETCDFKVQLPMKGHVTSLNASVAAAILLYQIDSRRNPL